MTRLSLLTTLFVSSLTFLAGCQEKDDDTTSIPLPVLDLGTDETTSSAATSPVGPGEVQADPEAAAGCTDEQCMLVAAHCAADGCFNDPIALTACTTPNSVYCGCYHPPDHEGGFRRGLFTGPNCDQCPAGYDLLCTPTNENNKTQSNCCECPGNLCEN